jgi:hypothetical protein
MSTSKEAVQVSRTILHGYNLDGAMTMLLTFQRLGQKARRKLGLKGYDASLCGMTPIWACML